MNTLLEQALEELKQLNKEEVFLVKELFKGYVWSRIPVAQRLQLGTLFLNEIQNNTKLVGKIEKLQKTTSGQQKYKIVEEIR